MKAVIMAGGRGSRLHPLTLEYPKPMIPFINKPLLAHTLNLLKRHDFTEVVITLHYLADQIQDYFGDGSSLGMTIHYAIEDKPLGTAGGVKNAQQYLGDETFLIMSGDTITDIDLSRALQFHHKKQAMATLVLKRAVDQREYGVAVTDLNGRVRQYLEKPAYSETSSNTVNTGIYFLEPEILSLMKSNSVYDFSYDIFPYLLKKKAPLFGHVADGYWSDIGTVDRYLETVADVLAGKVKYLELEHHYGDKVWGTPKHLFGLPDLVI